MYLEALLDDVIFQIKGETNTETEKEHNLKESEVFEDFESADDVNSFVNYKTLGDEK